MDMLTKCVVVLCLFTRGALSDSSWAYSGPTGPEYWCDLDLAGNQCCGDRQSPIVIDEASAVSADYLINFQGLDTVWDTVTLKNDGHTVVLTVPSDTSTAPSLTITTDPNQPPSDTYLFDSLHFHFGSVDSQGSEHLINNVARAMEMHVVFYNEKYGSFVASKNYSDGIVVIGVQFEISSFKNYRWDPLVGALLNVPWYEDTTAITPGFPLAHLLPSNLDDSFNYLGSLTTPVCNEAVTWFVLTNTVHLSESQIDHFRLLHNVTQTASNSGETDLQKWSVDTETLMFNNFRPPQAINGRTIYRQNPTFARHMRRLRPQTAKKSFHEEP